MDWDKILTDSSFRSPLNPCLRVVLLETFSELGCAAVDHGQLASLENMYVTPKIFGVELDNLRQLLAYFIGICSLASCGVA